MESKKGLSAELIIVIIVAVIILGVVVFMGIKSANKEEIVYGTTEATAGPQENLISDYKTYKRYIDKCKVDDTISINYKKNSMKERYTEEFFNTKKLAVVAVAEDTSKDYFHDITSVTYNEDRTQATIKYVYKIGGYAGSLSRSWFEWMVVELDNTVTSVNFVLDNESTDK